MGQLERDRDSDEDPLGLADLEARLREVEKSAILVPPRILRRVIKQDATVRRLGLRVPHRKTYIINREELLLIADPGELDLPPGTRLAETVILIARPLPEHFATRSNHELLLKVWRLLFHAKVHLLLEQRVARGQLDAHDVHQRIDSIGGLEFDEIRQVLKAEDMLLDPARNTAVYIEFAATYAELKFFAPSLVSTYFPCLMQLDQVDETLRQDFDAEALLETTQLAGAVLRLPQKDPVDLLPPTPPLVDSPQPARSRTHYQKLLTQADRTAAAGNLVRSAFLRVRAARYGDFEAGQIARAGARADLARLALRLQHALGFSDAEAEDWARSLGMLLDESHEVRWTTAGRMLYDLQKVCLDHERGIYTLDIFAWLTSLGRKPIRRWLPAQRVVMISKHLRIALRRLPAVRLTPAARTNLAALLETAARRAESKLRARFKPTLQAALDAVDLVPKNVPERVAREKLVEELLDRIVERGFLSMGDLRDALSRNNLKLPDLGSPKQLVFGDQLLRADKRLAATMDGVYRPGEIYLRLPQLLSSLAFGTALGRFLTRYIAIPFGGAFLILEGLQHILAIAGDVAAGSHQSHPQLQNPISVTVLGTLLLGLIYYDRFRRVVVAFLRGASIVLRTLIVDLPSRVLRLPVIQALVLSPFFRLTWQYVLKPALVTLAVVLVLWALPITLTTNRALLTFALVSVLLNSRIGRNVDEAVTDWLVHVWHRLRIHFFAALFRLIMDVFARVLEGIERMLYAVDEWLRFRTGEKPLAIAVKAVVGVVWAFVHYVIRFAVTLLIEPQINPIKHFPVVTVSHKILFPLAFPFLLKSLSPLIGAAWAGTIATTTTLVLPGMFGFLVWELKANWRLYSANRPRHLGTVRVGHHDETVLQFMKPGFRSGTLVKTYNRLRKASRRGLATGRWKAAIRQLQALEHVADAMRRFVDRELIALLNETRGWGGLEVTTGEVRLASNRILVELYAPLVSKNSLWLSFELRAGWAVASIHARGWLDEITLEQRTTFASALAGIYKMAGVSLVVEQLDAQLRPPLSYAISETGLIVRDTAQREIVYSLEGWPARDGRRSLPNASSAGDPEAKRIVFSRNRISWQRWAITWNVDQLSGGATDQVLDGKSLLPYGV